MTWTVERLTDIRNLDNNLTSSTYHYVNSLFNITYGDGSAVSKFENKTCSGFPTLDDRLMKLGGGRLH